MKSTRTSQLILRTFAVIIAGVLMLSTMSGCVPLILFGLFSGEEDSSTGQVEATNNPIADFIGDLFAGDPAVLPDFLANDASKKYKLDDDSTENKAIYKAETVKAEYVAKEYVDLLVERGYTIVFEEEKIYSRTDSGKTLKWDLYHSEVDADAVGSDSIGQVRVKLNVYTNWDECTISMEFSDGITMKNYKGGFGGSGGGGWFGGGGSNNNAKQPCNICNRTGDCQTCGGDGYLWSSAADKENRNCYKCRNHNGKCTNCDGKGWID